MSKLTDNKFYVDVGAPGLVRGGWFDEMGGMLVGTNAQWICDALNEKLDRTDNNSKMVTLFKGGSKEQTIAASEIVIHDLWHIAEYITDARQGNKVKEVWHICHALRAHIAGNQ